MLSDKNWRTLGTTLIVVLILVLAPGAGAQATFKTLDRFIEGSHKGWLPFAGLIFDQAGNLYGTTFEGGDYGNGCTSGCGVVFQLTPGSNGNWNENVLYRFCPASTCIDGSDPWAGLIFDAAGNLYGITAHGGKFGAGVVYELTPSNGGWTESVLYSFTGGSDGGMPAGGLIFDSSGNLYGTTTFYGAHDFGTVFELTPHSGAWTEKVLYDFTGGLYGGNPYSGVIFDAQGNLYGTTPGGGTNEVGVVFKLSPSKKGVWQISLLHSFTGGRDGGYPYYGSLIMDAAGSLYGTTGIGGADGYGTVFKLAQSAGKWKETVLHSFTDRDRDGAMPLSGVIFDSAGNLYGTTSKGGDAQGGCFSSGGCGVVFKLAPNSTGGWKETLLHVFSDNPGFQPFCDLILDSGGNLYGTTTGDQVTTFGSVFEVTP
jgi:uncharacterized repeat protein (TIGR03803 family)